MCCFSISAIPCGLYISYGSCASYLLVGCCPESVETLYTDAEPRTSCSNTAALPSPHARAPQYWLGPAPIVFTASGVASALAYLAMPVARDGGEILKIWLQASAPPSSNLVTRC